MKSGQSLKIENSLNDILKPLNQSLMALIMGKMSSLMHDYDVFVNRFQGKDIEPKFS